MFKKKKKELWKHTPEKMISFVWIPSHTLIAFQLQHSWGIILAMKLKWDGAYKRPMAPMEQVQILC